MTEENNVTAPETGAAAAAGTEQLSEDILFGRVAEIIAEVRPFIQSDGGDIELLKVEDNIVYVALTGACVGCPSSIVTLKQGVEVRIKEDLPQIESVEMV
jgi:Fe-S cluster biogenesis protein NfuA